MAIACTSVAISSASGLLAEQLTRKQLLAAIVYLLCTLNGMTCTAPALLQAANCLLCLNEKQLLAAEAYLLCVIANGGGGGGGTVFLQGVPYTGADPTSDGVFPPNLLGQALAIKPGGTTYTWSVANQDWE